MTIVQIISVKLSQTQTGKRIARLVVKELSLNQALDVTVWLNDAQWTFNVCDTVEMDMKKGKPYHGKDQYSASIESVRLVEGVIDTKVEMPNLYTVASKAGSSPVQDNLSDVRKIDGTEKGIPSGMLSAQQMHPPILDPKQDVWDKKDRRMCRMNALAHATEVVKLSLAAQGPPIPFSASDVTGLIQIEAESFENWIYRDDLSAKSIGFPK